jgi:hypothetical protein
LPDHDQAPTRHSNYPEVSYEDIFRDTGLDQRNVIFKTPDEARAFVGAWIEEETGWFKLRTGWTFSRTELAAMDEYYVLSIKKCIIAMVKMRVYERAMSVRVAERDHYYALREEMRRKIEGTYGKGGMIRMLWNPSRDVTASSIVYDDETIEDRITEV